MPRINFFIDVTEEEMSNFLARMSGADGRKVNVQADTAADDDGPAATNAPATDKNGVAWDARYHASSKALNADGTWRRKRGLSDTDAAAADAYEKGGAQTVTTADGAASMTVTDSGTVTLEAEQTVIAPSLPAAAPAPVGMPGLPMPAAPAAPEPVTYEEVVAAYTAAVAKNPSLDVAGLYAQAGVTDPNTLTTDAGAEQRIALKKLFEAA